MTTIGEQWVGGAERAAAIVAEVGPERATATDFRPGTLRHVVLFRFAPVVDVADVAAVDKRFTALATACVRDGRPYIRSIESGAQSSVESAGDGFDRAYLVTFDSEGDRNFYSGIAGPSLADPAHAAFMTFVGPFLDTAGVVVFDFRVEATA